MFKKLQAEYRKSGMNIFSFVYYTVKANADDRQIARKHKDGYLAKIARVNAGLDGLMG